MLPRIILNALLNFFSISMWNAKSTKVNKLDKNEYFKRCNQLWCGLPRTGFFDMFFAEVFRFLSPSAKQKNLPHIRRHARVYHE